MIRKPDTFRIVPIVKICGLVIPANSIDGVDPVILPIQIRRNSCLRVSSQILAPGITIEASCDVAWSLVFLGVVSSALLQQPGYFG